MPFITQGKTNWKFLLIVIILAIIVGGFSWWARSNRFEEEPLIKPEPTPTGKEKACIDSGGQVLTSLCCETSNDFPNSCLIGSCGCSLNDSHEVQFCSCGEGRCFNGSECVQSEALQ